MRVAPLLAIVLAASAYAQNWRVPDNLPGAGACNVVPFGSGQPPATVKFQTRCTAADLGAAPGQVTGLGFASCASGRAHFDQIEVVLAHIPAAQPLSATFASNLTPSAVTVLSATNYTWNLTADVWNEIGLNGSFAYNGVDDLLVQVTMTNGSSPAGFHRGARERVWWFGATGPAPAAGTVDFAAPKIEVSMLMARTSSHGDACAGSNGAPRHDLVGSPQPGSPLAFALANGVPNGVALLVVGTTIGAPFPLALGFIGMPGCTSYTDTAVVLAVTLGGTGAGSLPWTLPNTAPLGFVFYSEFACLDAAANAFGATTSNYERAFVGN